MNVSSAGTSQQQLHTAAAHVRRVPSYGSTLAWPETTQSAAHRSTASASAMKSTSSVSAVPRKNSMWSQGPCQQPVARQGTAQSRAAGTQMKRDTFLAANSSKAPTTQPTLRNAGQAAEHHPAMPAAGINSRINTKFLSERHRPVALRLPPLPTTVKTLELPKRSCPDRAPEKQKHQAPLPPVTPAQASPDLEKWEAPTHAWEQAPALQSTKVDTVPQETAMWKDEKPLGQSVAVVQKTNEQQVKHQGSTKSSQVAMSPARADSPVGAVPQGKHSRATVFPGAHEEEGEAALMEIPGTEVGTPHLTPAADSGNAAASPLAKYSQQPVTEAHVASTKELEAAEADVDFHMRAEATLPVFLDPLEEQHSGRPRCTKHGVAKEDLGTEKEEVKQEEKEKEQEWEKDTDQELSQLNDLELVTNCNVWIKALVHKLDVSTVQDINVNPCVPKLSQAPLTSSQEGSICPSSMGTDVAGEADGDLQSVSPALSGSTRTEPAAPTLAAAAEEEQHRAPHAAVAQEEEEAPAPASHGFDEKEAEAEAQRKAFDLLSPTASELARQEIASRLVSVILREALAVIQETKEQPLEQEDVAQSHVDATTARIRPAAVQDIETSVAAEPLAEASMNEQQTLVQAQTEAPAPQWVTVVDTAVQAVERQQVRRAPKKHQGEASTAVASPPSHEDERAGSPASVQAPSSLGFVEQQTTAQAQREAPALQRVTIISKAVQASVSHKVRRAPGKRHRKASTAIASPPLHEDEQTVSPAAVQDTQDEPGITALPDTEAVQKQRPSRFRRALKALRRAFRFSCISPQVEE
ncbi:uncharacterized protein ACIB01_011989 [Guaruba guarouba]